eukprot:scaffold77840_cov69-Phaeocystis_antarctica.AAC.7
MPRRRTETTARQSQRVKETTRFRRARAAATLHAAPGAYFGLGLAVLGEQRVGVDVGLRGRVVVHVRVGDHEVHVGVELREAVVGLAAEALAHLRDRDRRRDQLVVAGHLRGRGQPQEELRDRVTARSGAAGHGVEHLAQRVRTARRDGGRGLHRAARKADWLHELLDVDLERVGRHRDAAAAHLRHLDLRAQPHRRVELPRRRRILGRHFSCLPLLRLSCQPGLGRRQPGLGRRPHLRLPPRLLGAGLHPLRERAGPRASRAA